MSLKHEFFQLDEHQAAISIFLTDKAGVDDFCKTLGPAQQAMLTAGKFTAEPDTYVIIPDEESGWSVVAGVADRTMPGIWCLAKLVESLPEGVYRLAGVSAGRGAFGWAVGQYRFDKYLRKVGDKDDGGTDRWGPRVLLTEDLSALLPIIAEADATNLVRDMVNTPAEDMGPAAIESCAQSVARQAGVSLSVTHGDKLTREYPMVHAVGGGAKQSHAPRMIELIWGNPEHPRVAVVGKGVSFDSGGLDIKPPSSMLLMKKDMGGAAHALALARLIITQQLPVYLHLLIPAVENSVGSRAFRPGDVLTSRKGDTVEIGNTDAEGRLILADALARAGEFKPDLIIDYATLTGAARSALGPDLPALFARRDGSAEAFLAAGLASEDPCWRLPLHEPYRKWLKSEIADTNNTHTNAFAGASVAALFLDRFVPEGTDWLHLDIYAWRPVAMPGRPKGGDAYGLRAAWHFLEQRYR